MDKDKEIIKHSATCQISNQIDLMDRKVFNVLLYNSFPNIKTEGNFKIELNKLLNYLEVTTRNYDFIKNILTNLVQTAVTFNVLNKVTSDIKIISSWAVCGLLSWAEIKDGIITYQFPEYLQKKLAESEMYARIKLSIQNKLSSKYALALYELCLDYYDSNRRKGLTPKIRVNQLKRLLIGTMLRYPDFFEFNRKVIKRAVLEIEKESDLKIKVKYFKELRAVAYIQFEITKVQKNNIEKEIIKENNLTPEDLLSEKEKLDKIKLKEMLQQYKKRYQIDHTIN